MPMADAKKIVKKSQKQLRVMTKELVSITHEAKAIPKLLTIKGPDPRDFAKNTNNMMKRAIKFHKQLDQTIKDVEKAIKPLSKEERKELAQLINKEISILERAFRVSEGPLKNASAAASRALQGKVQKGSSFPKELLPLIGMPVLQTVRMAILAKRKFQKGKLVGLKKL